MSGIEQRAELANGATAKSYKIEFTWTVVPVPEGFAVEETHAGESFMRWGPIPSRKIAEALIDERMRLVKITYDIFAKRITA